MGVSQIQITIVRSDTIYLQCFPSFASLNLEFVWQKVCPTLLRMCPFNEPYHGRLSTGSSLFLPFLIMICVAMIQWQLVPIDFLVKKTIPRRFFKPFFSYLACNAQSQNSRDVESPIEVRVQSTPGLCQIFLFS